MTLTVAVAIMGYSAGLSFILETLRNCINVVDELVIIGDDFTENDTRLMEMYGAKVYTVSWNADFSMYKNTLISYVQSDWVCVLDHDEIPTEEMAQGLRALVNNAGNDYNIVGFMSINEVLKLDGTNEIGIPGVGKELLHINIPNPYHGDVHIWLNQAAHAWKGVRSDLAYRHVKTEVEIIERAVRNVWMGGGGDTLKEQNPLWKPLRTISARLNITTYREFLTYIQCENIDSELEDWIEQAYNAPWHDGELKQFKIYKEYYNDFRLSNKTEKLST